MTFSLSNLEQTVKADLSAGVSYLEQEALGTALSLWNILKGAFIALEPAAAQLLMDTLAAAVSAAGAGASIEAIETAALNTAIGDAKAILEKAGSGIIQVIIAGIKAST